MFQNQFRPLIWALPLLLTATAFAQGAPSLKPLSTFKDCSDCSEMVVMPAGSFQMGLSDEDGKKEGMLSGEIHFMQPVHRVNIKPFAIAKYPVTKAQFAQFVKATQYRSYGCTVHAWEMGDRFDGKAVFLQDANCQNPHFEQTPNDPVVCISWNDAQQYINWLNKKLAKNQSFQGKYRLPTESEWEYAARAGTTTLRYWGDDSGHKEQCQYENASDFRLKKKSPYRTATGNYPLNANCDDSYVTTAPVGSFKPNPWGLHDMLGNVSQWVEDGARFKYKDDLTDELAPTDGSVWMGGYKNQHVVRGGSWGSVPQGVLPSNRYSFDLNFKQDSLGFRLAKTIQ